MNVLEQFIATRWDIPAFAELMGVKLHSGQRRFCKELIKRDSDTVHSLWMTLCLSSGNQAGKTLLMAVIAMHHTMHKIGLALPLWDEKSQRDWSRAEYNWFHFGIVQEVSDLVWADIAAILEGRHAAQKGHGNPFVEALGQPVANVDQKERGEYRWVQFDPVFGGGQIHFRTTSERALGSLGKRVNGISFDECGAEPNLTFIVNEVLHMRRASTGGPMVLVSTPITGWTEWSDEWHKGDPGNPLKEQDRISLRMSTRENVGYGIDPAFFEKLLRGYESKPNLVAQNIDGFFVEGADAFFDGESVDGMFYTEIPEEAQPVKGAIYVQGADPGSKDATWSIVMRAENGKGVGVKVARKKGHQTLPAIANVVEADWRIYSANNECVTGLDTTGFGGHLVREALSGIRGLHSVEFGGTRRRKIQMLLDLKGLIETHRLAFPRSGIWLELRRQLLGYRLDDKLIETDGVMALAVASKMLLMRPDHAALTQPFDVFRGEPVEEQVEDGYAWARRGPTALDRILATRRGTVVKMGSPE